MKNIIKKTLKFVLTFAIVVSGIFCNTSSLYAYDYEDIIDAEEDTLIVLEDGREVTAEEFLFILYDYSGEIYESGDLIFENSVEENKFGTSLYSAGAIPIDDVMTIMAGTWYIPGIGKIVVAGGAILIGGVALYKVSGWIAEQVTNWLTARAFAKQVENAIGELGNVYSNKANKILADKHNWGKLFPGGPKDPNRWNKIKEIMKKVLLEGEEMPYKGVLKRVLKYKGFIIEVTYTIIDGNIRISNGWIK